MLVFAFLHRLFALASLALFAGGVWLLVDWWNIERVAEAFDQPEPGDGRLWWGLGLLAWSLLGRLPLLVILGRGGRRAEAARPDGVDAPGADGARLRVQMEGSAEGPILVLTHGWGFNSRIWAEARRDLSDRFGLATWDLPGSGRSGQPRAGWSLEGFAEDLAAVIDTIPAGRPLVLVGHSIGGMTTLTLAARRPDLLGSRVAGLVLENTTHTNPLKTMILSRLALRLQPLVEAACRLETVIWPVTWAMHWQSWMSGSTHLAMRLAGFGTRPTREQLDRAALLVTRTSPAVQAKGNLAMLRWSVTERMTGIDCPALVFVGGRDVVTKDHAGETIADALPRARLIRMAPAGHMGPIECAEAYHAEIVRFVGEVASAPSPAPGRGAPARVRGARDEVLPPSWSAGWDRFTPRL